MVALGVVISSVLLFATLALTAFFFWTRTASRSGSHQGDSEVRVVSDLDAILTRTVAFTFNGRTHKIPPLALSDFLLLTEGMARIESLKTKMTLSEAEVLDAYEALFRPACPTLRRREIDQMTVQQIGALHELIVKHVIGAKQFETEKKSPERVS
jgi:hypothetical protein